MQTNRRIIKRINTLYVVFFIMMALGVVLTFTSTFFSAPFRDGFKDSNALLNADERSFASSTYYGVPNRGILTPYDIELNSDSTTNYKVVGRVNAYDIKLIGKDDTFKNPSRSVMASIFMVVAVLLYCAMFVVIFMILGSLKGSAKRGVVFERGNIMLTRIIGKLLITASVISSLGFLLDNLAIAQYVHSNSFKVDVSLVNAMSFTELLTGILILFIAEIFAVGYDMSEEHKLTI